MKHVTHMHINNTKTGDTIRCTFTTMMYDVRLLLWIITKKRKSVTCMSSRHRVHGNTQYPFLITP